MNLKRLAVYATAIAALALPAFALAGGAPPPAKTDYSDGANFLRTGKDTGSGKTTKVKSITIGAYDCYDVPVSVSRKSEPKANTIAIEQFGDFDYAGKPMPVFEDRVRGKLTIHGYFASNGANVHITGNYKKGECVQPLDLNLAKVD